MSCPFLKILNPASFVTEMEAYGIRIVEIDGVSVLTQDIYERYWDLDTTFGKWNLDSAKKKMAHTKFLTVHFETGTIPPIYVLELVV